MNYAVTVRPPASMAETPDKTAGKDRITFFETVILRG